MMIYATFNESGFPTGLYAEDVHGGRMRPVYGAPPALYGEPPVTGYGPPPVIGSEPNPDCAIPADAIEITAEQRDEFVAYPGTRKWDGSAVVPYTPPPGAVEADDINAERQRRIVAGRVVNGVRVTGRDVDARNLMSLALIAQMRIAAGDTTTPTTFRDGDNVDHALTPPQILTMWQESAAFVSAIYQASWDIKAMNPIPVDFAADQYWL
jgi:hypothetical protein